MKIAVIGHTIFFREETLRILKSVADVRFGDVSPTDAAFLEYGKDADLIITWGLPSPAIVEQLSALKSFCYLHTGCDDLLANKSLCAAFHHRKITIINTPDYCSATVAEYALAMLLGLARRINHSIELNRGTLAPAFKDFIVPEFFSLHLGIFGYGKIGSALAAIARPLVKSIRVCTRTPSKIGEGDASVSIDDLFSSCGAIAMCADLNDSTFQSIDSTLLLKLPRFGVVVNATRAQIFKMADISTTLTSRPDLSISIDKIPSGHRATLNRLPNIFITPHIASMGTEALLRCTDVATENIVAMLLGKPFSLVNY